MFNVKKIYLSVYRTVGMAMLITMTVSLIGYGALLMFFMANASWIAPTVMTSTSDKMLQFKSGYLTATQNLNTIQIALATARGQVDLLERRKTMIDAALADLEKTRTQEIGAASTFILQTKPIVGQKQIDVQMSSQLSKETSIITRDADANLRAKLITQAEYISIMTGTQSFSNQSTNGALDLATSKARIDEETRKVQALNGKAGAMSVVAFAMSARELKQQWLEADQAKVIAQDTVNRLLEQESLALQTVANLKNTAYMAAAVAGANLAFVPYENADAVRVGASVYDCTLKVVWCHQVGSIRTVYTDEHTVSYPVFNVKLTREVRGVMIDLDVIDPEAMKNLILFIGKPLFL
jgi:hypothetical protein